MFEWMAWTTPVAVFFICIVLMLIGMTVWEIKSPTILRKGFLPMETTTRGSPVHRPAQRCLREPDFCRHQWPAGRVDEPGERALDLDQLRGVDGVCSGWIMHKG
jgi:hypothetical protein